MATHRAALVLYGLGLFLASGALAMAAATPAVAAGIFAAGSLVVYAFLCYVRYLPTPVQVSLFLERRRRLRETLIERAKQSQAPRAGRISDERFQPAAGPER